MRLLFLLLLVTTTTAFIGKNRFNKLRKLQVDLDANDKHLLSEVAEQWFTQKLDHFNETDEYTWKQMFYSNDAFYKDGGPEFLMIGGEGPESPAYIVRDGIPLVEWAKKLNARLWILEHRFYGQSHPKPTQTTENLKYLTSQQALADLANFIRSKNDELQLTNPKWVVFGGSYPGALALWFRVLYPELTVGAVGSSAPLDIQMDFYGYLRVCQEAYRSYSQKCADNIGKAFRHLRQFMDFKRGRSRLEDAMHVEPLFEKQNLTFTDLQNFYGNVFGMFQGAVQYSRVNAGGYPTGGSIPDVCKIMEEPVFSPVTHLINVHKYMVEFERESSDVFDDDYEGMIEYLKNPDFGKYGYYSAARSWTWQTCNEFGYFQSTAFETNIFGTGTPADYYYNMCTDIFGKEYNVDYVKAATRRTQDFYGEADEYNGTHVVIPNGSIDPWHALGTYVSDFEKDQHAYLITGSAHCADMSAPGPNDVPGLGQVRSLIFEKLQEWTGNKVSAHDSDLNRTDKKKVVKSEVKEAEKKVKMEKKMKVEKIDVKNVCFECGGNEKSLPKVQDTNKKLKFKGGRYQGMPGLLDQSENIFFADDVGYPNISEFNQIVDHFDDNNDQTFTQYFYLNEKYYKEGGPLFLFIGGEGPLGTKYAYDEQVPLVMHAKEVNAAIYAVEHRYYGDSTLTKDLSVPNLKYLISRQALEDLAYFIKTINEAKGYKNPKWITFGGSYAGALSAWFRKLYPDLTVGTIGSSGPVEAKVDYFEYMQVVANSTSACKDKIKEGIDTIQKQITSVEGRKLINDKLVPCDPRRKFDAEYIEAYDEMEFFSDLVGQFMGAVQYNKHGPKSEINQICKIWNNDNYDVYRKFKLMNPCYEFDYQSTIDQFSDIELHGRFSNTRLWFWQTCNEFGYYQSTDIGYNTFGSSVPVNYFIGWCHRAYDSVFTRDKIEQNIKETQKFYGGARGYKATKHLHIYHTVDPWHALGFYTDNEDHGEDVRSFLVDGTSHCADMYYPNKYDPEGLKEARNLILETIKRWIK
ncbi:unnamed protein product [Bursaphelenchus okinawaensis]|uniref:Uncharacterized protein n=1 Tax=Bursaphelenchus okinawaensis TaxID=465554 RepID=A0A811LPD4_9BILA|nr:unnamed protein product [Bursaphelenchus okinawaensis]CAG9124914.1 unnamed protein product [Bursaphelenchus okinawaensis]